jgi:hypothetical protein
MVIRFVLYLACVGVVLLRKRMRRGSLERDFLKVRKVKVGTLGTIEHYFIIKDLAWNITWNNVGTKRHFVGKFKVLDKQNRIVYSLISENGNKGIPKKQRATALLQ